MRISANFAILSSPRNQLFGLEQRPEGVVGLLGQRCSTPRRKPKGSKPAPRYTEPRKTQCWAALEAAGSLAVGAQWIYVAACESDFYEPMEICQRREIDEAMARKTPGLGCRADQRGRGTGHTDRQWPRGLRERLRLKVGQGPIWR